MYKVLFREIALLHKNKIAYGGYIATILVPLLLFLKACIRDEMNITYSEWVMTISTLVNLVLPLMSGLFITRSMQKEYRKADVGDNSPAAAVRRPRGLAAKIVVWLGWYLAVLLVVEVLTLAGAVVLFGPTLPKAAILSIIQRLTKTGLFSFLASLPLVWITVKQRRASYPSLLFTLFFTGLQAVGLQVSVKLLPLASLLPWTAVSVTQTLSGQSGYYWVGVASILLAGGLGVGLALREIKRQATASSWA